MEGFDFNNYLLILAIPAIGIVFENVIKESIKKVFKTLDSRQLNMILVSAVCILSCFSYLIIDEYAQIEAPSEVVQPEKSEIEEYVEVGKVVIEEIAKATKNKKQKDSLARASKEPLWVIRIGKPNRSVKSLWSLYKKLDTIPNIRVFKESRKQYLLIKDNGLTLNELKIDLENLKESIQNIETDIRIINLNESCRTKQQIVEINPLRLRKEDLTLKCFSCG